jgi:integrase/recombinase XerD
MSKLRQKMIRAMELKNLSDNTQRTYLTAVTGLTKHYQKSPDKISKEMIEYYLLYLKNEKGKCPNSCASALSGLRFFYKHVTHHKISIDFSLTRKVRNLPTVLPYEDIWSIISAADNLKHRMILMTTYSAGLRASEVTALKPENIDSKTMLIKVTFLSLSILYHSFLEYRATALANCLPPTFIHFALLLRNAVSLLESSSALSGGFAFKSPISATHSLP